MITKAGLHKSRNNMTGNKKEAVRQFYEIPQTTLKLNLKSAKQNLYTNMSSNLIKLSYKSTA